MSKSKRSNNIHRTTKSIYILNGLTAFILIFSLLFFGFNIQSTIDNSSIDDNNSDNELIYGTGTIIYLKIEGGFYGILSDDGEHYDPINLPIEYQQDGLRISFIAKERSDLLSFHMWGKIVELISIYPL